MEFFWFFQSSFTSKKTTTTIFLCWPLLFRRERRNWKKFSSSSCDLMRTGNRTLLSQQLSKFLLKIAGWIITKKGSDCMVCWERAGGRGPGGIKFVKFLRHSDSLIHDFPHWAKKPSLIHRLFSHLPPSVVLPNSIRQDCYLHFLSNPIRKNDIEKILFDDITKQKQSLGLSTSIKKIFLLFNIFLIFFFLSSIIIICWWPQAFFRWQQVS